MVQLGASTAIFVLAATAAKAWTLNPGLWRLALVLTLYSLGNLIMLRLIREFGMGIALSLSAVIQLVAVNLVALLWYGERLDTYQTVGVLAAIVAIALITVGPYLSAR
jgi:multidrug transporter EmrE-like cation transporter